MKKYLIVIVFALLLTGCGNNKISSSNKNVYQEIKTTITDKDIDENPVERIAQEIKLLQSKGETFWYDQNHNNSGRTPMVYLQFRLECKNDIKAADNCAITGVQADKNYIPSGFKVDKCDKDGLCLVTSPAFSKIAANKIKNPDNFLAGGNNIYSVGSVNNDDIYSVFENDKEIFSHKMFSGGTGVFADQSMVLDSPAFTFYDYKIKNGDENNPIVNSNIYYKGETFNEKYDLSQSFHLFSFKDKVGFVGEKDGKEFIFFNGRKVSGDFDKVRADCCAVAAYPVGIDENGILFFMGKRGEKYIFTEINLNEYLK